jgi:AmmeMemoRadiSam system protein B
MNGQAESLSVENDSSRIRGLVDTVGYPHTQEQIEAVVRMCDSLENSHMRDQLTDDGIGPDVGWIAGICPHDDYLYAGRIYFDVMRNMRARQVILFGVAHRARDFNVDNRLVFDSYAIWHGPYGPVPVSPLRQAIMGHLSPADFVVSDSLQKVEHSVEGLIPFLQYYSRNVEIVSILVPYMSWERLDELSRHLAQALSEIVSEGHLELGRDVAFLCSNDCVHYGDQGWGGKNYAPFGADVEGYEKAVERDQNLIHKYVTGELQTHKLRDLFMELVDQNDVRTYRITWCGRFSVPLGLNSMVYLMQDLHRPPLTGHYLGYDTSVASGELPLRDLGLGTTAPSNLHHWVGYGAIGYR